MKYLGVMVMKNLIKKKTRQTLSILLIAIITVSTVSISDYYIVSALNIEGDRDSFNEALENQNVPPFFKPFSVLTEGTCSVTDSIGGPVVLSGKTNFEKIASYFAGKGLKDIAIAGILANLQHESGLSPFRIQNQTKHTAGHGTPPVGLGYGLAQFTPSTKIKSALQATGHMEYFSTKYGGAISSWSSGGTSVPEGVPEDVNDAFMGAQLDFLYNGELQSTKVYPYRNMGGVMGLDYIQNSETIISALKNARNEKDAARIFVWIYERPKDKPGAAVVREKLATEMLPTVKKILAGDTSTEEGGAVDPLSSTTPVQECLDSASLLSAGGSGSGSMSDFQATVKSFAWEDGRRNYTTPKPAYTEAIGSGLYKGGDPQGRDCGAFVSALMRKSGFDTSYVQAYSGEQIKYLNNNWDLIYTPKNVEVSKLQPGDVAARTGHVFVWIGDIEGFISKSAEAALASRTAPTAIKSTNTYSAPSEYTWYRKKGVAM